MDSRRFSDEAIVWVFAMPRSSRRYVLGCLFEADRGQAYLDSHGLQVQAETLPGLRTSAKEPMQHRIE